MSAVMRATRLAAAAACLDARAAAQAARAAACIAASHALLHLVGYRTTGRVLMRLATRDPKPGRSEALACGAISTTACARAIARAARLLPWTTCLTHALAASYLLRRAGRTPTMTIGVALERPRALRAHAWVDCDGTRVCGAGDDRYESLSAGAKAQALLRRG